ncbi:MAG TPA: hypothetical protein VHR72_07610 [Gemmataceae bacterium]|jgi:hypothetical protein|nr:hypothetical protein [Gemmataceae bacterium]
MDQIRALLEAGADLTLMNGEGKGFTPLAFAMDLRRKTAERLLREFGAPEKGRRPFGPKPKKKPLDLERDFTEILAHLIDVARSFDPSSANVLGESGLVRIVEVGFEYEQSGWLVVVFDTRPNAEPDGEWTARIEGNQLARPHWLEAGEALCDGSLSVVRANGKKGRLSAGTELAEILGEVVEEAVLKARELGAFAGLPMAAGCELGIEHFGGAYGWPAYEERGHENRIEPTQKST